MEYRKLGRSGVLVSPLCLGTMNFGGSTNETDSFTIMQKAVEGGINFFDTANVYNKGESERITGKFLKENNLRGRVVLATKVFSRMGDLPNEGGGTRYHIIKACEDSLQRLQTDHIDLYQLHRPPLSHPQDETLRAFDDLIRAGKVHYIGCSTHPAWMVMEALSISEHYGLNRYISEQPPYNLLDRRIENELVPLCQKYDLAILPWSPLAMGILAGRYPETTKYPEDSRAHLWDSSMVKARITQRAIDVGKAISGMAQERSLTASQLSLLWTKDQLGITAPIIGPRTLAHLEDALGILDKAFDQADRPLFDELVHPGTAVADFHNSNEWMKARILFRNDNNPHPKMKKISGGTMQTFYADCLNNFQELHDDVTKTIEGLPPEALDWSPKSDVNSITVLIVHLTGSQKFLFGEVIGGQDVHRDRDAEFLVKGMASDVLIQRLNDSLEYVAGVLEGLTIADLERKCMFRTREVTVGWAIGHSLKHTATHLGHIQVMRDMWDQF